MIYTSSLAHLDFVSLLIFNGDPLCSDWIILVSIHEWRDIRKRFDIFVPFVPSMILGMTTFSLLPSILVFKLLVKRPPSFTDDKSLVKIFAHWLSYHSQRMFSFMLVSLRSNTLQFCTSLQFWFSNYLYNDRRPSLMIRALFLNDVVFGIMFCSDSVIKFCCSWKSRNEKQNSDNVKVPWRTFPISNLCAFYERNFSS